MVDEPSRLRKELRRVKEALADAHVDLALERAFLEAACEELNEPLDKFKKGTSAGGAPSGRGRCQAQGDAGLRASAHDGAKLLCAKNWIAVLGDTTSPVVRVVGHRSKPPVNSAKPPVSRYVLVCVIFP